MQNLVTEEQSDYSLWKATKRIKKPIISIPPIPKEDDTWVHDNKQNAGVFAYHLAEIFKPYFSQNNVMGDIFDHRSRTSDH